MNNKQLGRLHFLRLAAFAGVGLSTASVFRSFASDRVATKKVGIIGLDTSHSVAFTKALNDTNAGSGFMDYKIVAAYPKGSTDIPSSVKRIPAYTEEVRKYGVQIVDSIAALLKQVDYVLLETNDGRLHRQQALEVIKAGKPVFIDKPVAASLADAMAIYEAAEKYKVPVFSSSSLRFMKSVQDVVHGEVGKVLGADTYSPATLEATHPDLFWYGIHGVETLFAVMGTGCAEVMRVTSGDTDKVVGLWQDGRIGSFRGTRSGRHEYGGIVYGEKGNVPLGPFDGYNALLEQIIRFFDTGIPPVSPKETLEIFAFMEAADKSKSLGGSRVKIDSVMQAASKRKKNV